MKRLSSAERGNREAYRRMELCRRQKVPTLDLSDLGIKQVPEELASFDWLTHLDLSDNRLTKVPEFIGNLTDLTWLDMSSNKFYNGYDRRHNESLFDGIKALPSHTSEYQPYATGQTAG